MEGRRRRGCFPIWGRTLLVVASDEGPGEVLAAISTELVQLHLRLYGKGPNKGKTFIREDMVVCVLTGGLTKLEQSLVDKGDRDTVHRVRRGLREEAEAPAKAIVERATGRKVIAYMGAIEPEADLEVEVFVLAPSSEG